MRWRYLLWPFSLLYLLIVSLRNTLFDWGFLKQQTFDTPLIVIGNLNIGGSGKTPMTSYLIDLFSKHQKKIAVLSRGYKRKSKGFLWAAPAQNVQTMGDEPWMLYTKYDGAIDIAVCEKRTKAIPIMQKKKPPFQAIFLDDAFQHRYVKGTCSIILTPFHKPFFKDHMLPAGDLREPASGLKRANVVVVTKCPSHVPAEIMEQYTQRIQSYHNVPVWFSGYRYGSFQPIGEPKEMKNDIVLLTGIADAQPLVNYLKSQPIQMKAHLAFPDHYQYKLSDILRAIKLCQQHQATLLTTEKDLAKLIAFKTHFKEVSAFFIPITIHFLKDGTKFDDKIMSYVENIII